MLRTFAAIGLLSACVLLDAGAASAGGSHLEPEQETYRPGEIATVSGFVGIGQLGWVDDGPFDAWLRTRPDPAGDEAWAPPGEAPGDVALGPLTIVETGEGGYRALRISISFEVPSSLGNGVYDLVYRGRSNDGIGDLIGGFIRVAGPALPTTSTTVARPVDVVPAVARSNRSEPPLVLILGIGVVILAAGFGLLRVRSMR